jgi:hypothetical protein
MLSMLAPAADRPASMAKGRVNGDLHSGELAGGRLPRRTRETDAF